MPRHLFKGITNHLPLIQSTCPLLILSFQCTCSVKILRETFLQYILQRYENELFARKLLICNLMDQKLHIWCHLRKSWKAWICQISRVIIVFKRGAHNPYILHELFSPAVQLWLKALCYASTVLFQKFMKKKIWYGK